MQHPAILERLSQAHPQERLEILSRLLAAYESASPRNEAFSQMKRDLAQAALYQGGRERISALVESLEEFVRVEGMDVLAMYGESVRD